MYKRWDDWFYHSKAWVKCRNGFMASKHFICERCGDVAVIAHHKTHITPANINDPNVVLNWDNLEALCITCHNAVHGCSTQITQDGLAFDGNGNLVKTPHPVGDMCAKGERNGQQ